MLQNKTRRKAVLCASAFTSANPQPLAHKPFKPFPLTSVKSVAKVTNAEVPQHQAGVSGLQFLRKTTAGGARDQLPAVLRRFIAMEMGAGGGRERFAVLFSVLSSTFNNIREGFSS